MKKTDQLSVVHAAYIAGADTPSKVEEATGVQYTSAKSCLSWIRKAEGDLERARQLRNATSAQTRKRRYHTDPEFRDRVNASSTAYASRLRHELLTLRKKMEDQM